VGLTQYFTPTNNYETAIENQADGNLLLLLNVSPVSIAVAPVEEVA
jgi:hypothetical protein